MRKFLCLLLIAFLFASCAGSFKSINPTSFQYTTPAEKSDVELYYKYDVLRERGNKKYSRKEFKANVRIVAIRITNTTSRELKMGDNARIYSGNSEIRLWPPDLIHKKVKQTVPLYLLYLLLTPAEFSMYDSGTSESSSFPIGLILGPGLAGGNIAVAGSANARLKRELMEFDLYGKAIKPGETVYGLIGIPEIGFLPLRVVVTP
jgi:hypothetical protein